MFDPQTIPHRYSSLMVDSLATKRQLFDFLKPDSTFMRRKNDPGICDFVFGNPQEMPIPGLVEAIQRAAEPKNKDWFSYLQSWPRAQAAAAKSLRATTGLPYEPGDVVFSNGSFGAISVILRTLSGPGDEVVFMTPPWFNYASMIAASGAVPVKLRIRADDFDLDLDAIEAAINKRTAVVIVNSPHNPTGKIYTPQTLERLGEILETARERHGRMIYLLSDESYNRVIFDGREFSSPAVFYPRALTTYTYGKTLLAPGARLGYIAISPNMPDRSGLKEMLMAAQLASGWAYPDNIMMYALEDLDGLSIDLGRLQRKRDRMVSELRAYGYSLHVPEGTFYLVVKSPLQDDPAFCDKLAARGILVMPGTILEMPGYFRISLTASDEMIEGALPGFKAVIA